MSDSLGIAVDDLLAPCAKTPGGVDPKEVPQLGEIRALRRKLLDSPYERKTAIDLIDQCVKAFGLSKSLLLCGYLTEGLIAADGFAGAASGLVVLRRLLTS